MTAQMSDVLTYEGEQYAVLADPQSLFDPRTYGFEPAALSSACWRGYLCSYTVVDGRLVLESLTVRVEDTAAPRVVALSDQMIGRAPSSVDSGVLTYDELNLPIDYTGELIAASGFVQELYVHMGFPPAWKFEKVLALELDGGTVQAVHDRSEQYAQEREEKRANIAAD